MRGLLGRQRLGLSSLLNKFERKMFQMGMLDCRRWMKMFKHADAMFHCYDNDVGC